MVRGLRGIPLAESRMRTTEGAGGRLSMRVRFFNDRQNVRRRIFFSKTLLACDIMLVQEAQCTLEQIEVVIPHMTKCHYFFVNLGQGTTIIIVSKKWAGNHPSFEPHNFVEGRVQRLIFRRMFEGEQRFRKVSVWNIHNRIDSCFFRR